MSKVDTEALLPLKSREGSLLPPMLSPKKGISLDNLLPDGSSDIIVREGAPPVEYATWTSAWFNITNITVGAGTLSLPFAVHLCGLAFGISLVLLCAVLAHFSLRLLLHTAHITGKSSYQEVAMFAFGKRMALLVDCVIIVQCVGIVLAYVIIIGDIVPPLLQQWLNASPSDPMVSRTSVIAMVVFLAVLPLSLLTKIDFLRYTSLLALGAMTYVAAMTVAWAVTNDFNDIERGNFNDHPDPKVEVVWSNFGTQVFFALPIMALAFTSHIQVYKIVDEMGPKPVSYLMRIVSLSIGSCLTIYIVVAIFAYLTFYNVVDGNVLNNYTEEGNAFVVFAKVGLAITLLFSTPLFVHPLRESIHHVLSPMRTVPVHLEPFTTMKEHFITTLAVIVVVFTLGVLIPDVAAVLSLTGAMCSTCVMYIFPALFYCRLNHECADHGSRGALLREVCAKAMAFFGAGVGVLGTISAVIELVDNNL